MSLRPVYQETGQLLAVDANKATPGAAYPASRAFWCALGNLYAAARTEVMRLGHAAALRPDASESPMLQNVSSPSLYCLLNIWLLGRP